MMCTLNGAFAAFEEGGRTLEAALAGYVALQRRYEEARDVLVDCRVAEGLLKELREACGEGIKDDQDLHAMCDKLGSFFVVNVQKDCSAISFDLNKVLRMLRGGPLWKTLENYEQGRADDDSPFTARKLLESVEYVEENRAALRDAVDSLFLRVLERERERFDVDDTTALDVEFVKKVMCQMGCPVGSQLTDSDDAAFRYAVLRLLDGGIRYISRLTLDKGVGMVDRTLRSFRKSIKPSVEIYEFLWLRDTSARRGKVIFQPFLCKNFCTMQVNLVDDPLNLGPDEKALLKDWQAQVYLSEVVGRPIRFSLESNVVEAEIATPSGLICFVESMCATNDDGQEQGFVHLKRRAQTVLGREREQRLGVNGLQDVIRNMVCWAAQEGWGPFCNFSQELSPS